MRFYEIIEAVRGLKVGLTKRPDDPEITPPPRDPNLADDEDDPNEPAEYHHVLNKRFTDRDRQFINAKTYRPLVIKKLNKVPLDLYVYIIDNEKTRKHIQMVSGLYFIPGKSDYYRVFTLADKLRSPNTKKLLKSIGLHIPILNILRHPKAVHLLITHNDPYTDSFMPLTPWMIVHRLAHGVLDGSGPTVAGLADLEIEIKGLFESIIEHFGDPNYLGIFRFKSARPESTVKVPFESESWVEAYTSYLVKGGSIYLNQLGDDPEYINGIEYEMNELFKRLTEMIKGLVITG